MLGMHCRSSDYAQSKGFKIKEDCIRKKKMKTQRKIEQRVSKKAKNEHINKNCDKQDC